jgi:hypothetical protein
MAPSGGRTLTKTRLELRLEREYSHAIITEADKHTAANWRILPVSAFRLGFIGKKFKTLLLLEQKGLIAQGKTSLLGRLWSLTDAGRRFLK